MKKSKKIKKNFIIKKSKNENLISKLVKLQLSIKPNFKISFNFNLEKYIQAFFDKIANSIFEYKTIKKEEARRIKLEKQEEERLEKIKFENEKQKKVELKTKLNEQALKEEIKLEKQRTRDIKLL